MTTSMREYLVGKDDSGQRLDKYLRRVLPLAPSSFFYKMLRKKNITLQGKKADGSERIREGDKVALFLSDETIGKFSGTGGTEAEDDREAALLAYRRLSPLLKENPVLYEDSNILIIRKPAGVLSQKASASDLSMNEWIRGYLLQKAGEGKREELEKAGEGKRKKLEKPGEGKRKKLEKPGEGKKEKQEKAEAGRREEPEKTGEGERDLYEAAGFRPAVCNRLDRNTGGILLCAKSLRGSRALSAVIRNRKIRKTYRMVVHGQVTEPGVIEGELIKDRSKNRVRVADQSESASESGTRHSVTVYRPIRAGRLATLVEADLITGRSHQLRVHMASIGHPIVFDPGYGDREKDSAFPRAGQKARGQMLWCVETAFPEQIGVEDAGDACDVLFPLRGRSFRSPEPAWWRRLYEE